MICTWNGTATQAKAYVESIRRVQAKKERMQKMAKWFSGNAAVWAEREAFEMQYFGEVV